MCGMIGSCRKSEPVGKTGSVDPAPATPAVKVNGAVMTFGELDGLAAGYLKYAREREGLVFASNMLGQAQAFYRKKAAKTFIYKTVMLEEAARLKIQVSEQDRQEGLRQIAEILKRQKGTVDDFFKKGPQPEAVMRREFNDSLLIQKLLRQSVQQAIKVPEAEIVAAMKSIAATNIQKRATLEAARKQIQAGTPFEQLARTLSECPSAARGGDLGEFPRGKQDKLLEDAIFGLPPGRVSEVVETNQGYHLIKVKTHTPAQPATATVPAVPETVRAAHILIKSLPLNRPQVTQALMRAKFEKERRAFFEALRCKARIECPLYPDLAAKRPAA